MPLKFQLFILAAPVLLFSMVAHEYAHGYAAKQQGDPTAYQLGRLTWNPLKHIDPFLTVILPLMTWFLGNFLFGGAKPVPVVPRNYRNYKRGDIIVSLAGIATNLVLAVIATVAIVLVGLLGRAVPEIAESCAILQVMLTLGMVFNVILAYFNLLPIPPLDGSHVMKYLLPPAWAVQYQNLGRFGLLILLLLFTVGGRAFGMLLYPAYHLMGLAIRLTFPFIIPSQTVPNPFLGLA
ncbi:MAG TPA: site-2 protease family protein [Gemmatimonadaceae bacterium]|nr:site-2 protease family protein [Gemmatimonadaceae bacterium]